mmetsp:Transcript_45281/g.125642  ORF Transcript_45281/g.125642 Transcript_45281/m.125642 type:complete len:203 (+) Transcript_45281:442-1050(+)
MPRQLRGRGGRCASRAGASEAGGPRRHSYFPGVSGSGQRGGRILACGAGGADQQVARARACGERRAGRNGRREGGPQQHEGRPRARRPHVRRTLRGRRRRGAVELGDRGHRPDRRRPPGAARQGHALQQLHLGWRRVQQARLPLQPNDEVPHLVLGSRRAVAGLLQGHQEDRGGVARCPFMVGRAERQRGGLQGPPAHDAGV